MSRPEPRTVVSRPDLDGVRLALAESAPLPIDADGPVFAEPWQAQAFAMALALHERDIFTWAEWADALAAQIRSDPGAPYYLHWLATVETMSTAKALTTPEALSARRQEWQLAAHATPHGQPIVLPGPVVPSVS